MIERISHTHTHNRYFYESSARRYAKQRPTRARIISHLSRFFSLSAARAHFHVITTKATISARHYSLAIARRRGNRKRAAQIHPRRTLITIGGYTREMRLRATEVVYLHIPAWKNSRPLRIIIISSCTLIYIGDASSHNEVGGGCLIIVHFAFDIVFRGWGFFRTRAHRRCIL